MSLERIQSAREATQSAAMRARHAQVAWVTGASRGIGRGVAVALGQCGWTVYVTARSSSSIRIPGSIESTADAVSAAGGEGIALACDHRDDAAVASVARRVEEAHQHLNLLVNNVWGGYERLAAGAWEEWTAPMWRQPLDLFDAMFSSGVRAHYVALALCAPLLVKTAGSMVVTVSMSIPEREQERHGVAYGMAKAADNRLALAAALQLKSYGVTSIAVHPDWVRTEGVMYYADRLDLTGSQSPEGVGRAIAALAKDPERFTLTGQALPVTDLAVRYGVDVLA